MKDSFKNLYLTLKFPIKSFAFNVLDFLAIRIPFHVKPKSMLVLRLDLLGDFVFFYPFLNELLRDPNYKSHSITLLCNQANKGIWACIPNPPDQLEIWWLDKNKFNNSIFYRFQWLKKIRQTGFETVLNPVHTKVFFLESLVKVAGSPFRISSNHIGTHLPTRQLHKISNFYTRQIETLPAKAFEFENNRSFFESFLNRKLEEISHRQRWKMQAVEGIEEGFVLFFPGASAHFRRWGSVNFAQLAKQIHQTFGLKTLISGTAIENEIAMQIKDMAPEATVNWCGKTSLAQTLWLIEKADLIVSNESGPVHLAASLDKKVVCISNGNHYGRWNPYPSNYQTKLSYIYPAALSLLSENERISRFYFGSDIDINQIPFTDVWPMVSSILNQKKMNF